MKIWNYVVPTGLEWEINNYWLWVVGCGLWVINRKPETENLKPVTYCTLSGLWLAKVE